MTNKNNTKFFSIMLVDDNEIDNLINQKMIEVSGICEKIFVHSGAKSAIEFLKNLEKLTAVSKEILPDVIFLDVDMPLMDGFQFLDQFEQLGEDVKSHCKIVMLTSSINPLDVNRAKESSYITKYINKPLTQDTLLSLDI